MKPTSASQSEEQDVGRRNVDALRRRYFGCVIQRTDQLRNNRVCKAEID